MRLLRFFLKILAIPFAICFWLLKWIGIFLTMMSGWIFYCLASLMFLLGLTCLLFATATFSEVLPLWCVSFLVFGVPFFGVWVTGLFAAAGAGLHDFILS